MKKIALVAGIAASSFAALPAFAQNSTDYSGLTGAVDFTAVVTALLAVAALVAAVLVVRKGIRFILGAIR